MTARLAFFTFVLAFFVILLGAFTRLTDAGLSCPDWPNCYGFITAPHTDMQLEGAALRYPMAPVNVKKAWTEMTHRYFAGTEGVLILVLSFSLLLGTQIRKLKAMKLTAALLALVMVQVVLGMLTVTEQLKPVIVLSHLLTGISLLGLLFWIFLDIRQPARMAPATRPWVTPAVFAALVIVFAQIALGGWVSTHYAGLACVDFPYCNGSVLPTMAWNQLDSDLVSIHMLHRLGAAISASFLILLSLFLVRLKAFRINAAMIISLLSLQVTLGITSILWLRPIPIALMHQAVGILLLLTVIATLQKSIAAGKSHV